MWERKVRGKWTAITFTVKIGPEVDLAIKINLSGKTQVRNGA